MNVSPSHTVMRNVAFPLFHWGEAGQGRAGRQGGSGRGGGVAGHIASSGRRSLSRYRGRFLILNAGNVTPYLPRWRDIEWRYAHRGGPIASLRGRWALGVITNQEVRRDAEISSQRGGKQTSGANGMGRVGIFITRGADSIIIDEHWPIER